MKSATLTSLRLCLLPVALLLTTAMSAQQATPPPVQSPEPARAHHKAKIVNNADAGPTIHFSACRENDKQHVSCQFTDPDGATHWVYLAGYKFSDIK